MVFFSRGVLIGALLAGQAAFAEEGFYYGVTAGYSDITSSSSGIGETSGQDFSLGGVAGYGYSLPNGATLAFEGTLDLTSANTLTDPGGFDSCTSNSPDWCEVESIARIRAVYFTTLANGNDVLSMAGFAAAQGRAEDGPGNYVNTTATGYTLGLGYQTDMGSGSARYELVYDNFDSHDPEAYDKTLEIYSLRFAYMF